MVRVLLNFIEFKAEKRCSKSSHVFFVKCPYILCLSVCLSAWATCGLANDFEVKILDTVWIFKLGFFYVKLFVELTCYHKFTLSPFCLHFEKKSMKFFSPKLSLEIPTRRESSWSEIVWCRDSYIFPRMRRHFTTVLIILLSKKIYFEFHVVTK